MHAICQSEVSQHNGAATQRAMGANARTARHTHATGHGRVFADVHVVANLNEVVEFDTVFNEGVLQGASVDASVGANLYIIANFHGTELFNFFPSALVQGKAKSVSAYHDP